MNQNDLVERLLTVLNSTGSNRDYTEFNLLQYYMENFQDKPSTLYYREKTHDFYDHKILIEEFKKEFPDFKLINEYLEYNFKYDKQIPKQQYFHICDGYLLEISSDLVNDDFEEDEFEDEEIEYTNDDTLIVDYNILLIPNTDSKDKSEDVENKITNVFKKSKLLQNEEVAYLSMITMDNGELFVEDFEMTSKVEELIEPDLHYGDGFYEWHKKFMKKVKKTKKGLSLLYGKTGTGKTHYIRYLINTLTKEDKKILYFSPMMVSAILDPSFINFIINWCKGLDNKDVIFLIEDAEPLLYNRTDDRNIGISNLLNLTDGLLNDLLGIQIIATFNVELSALDNALLRPERLIAKKEFKNLNKSEISKLTEYLKIDLNGYSKKDEMSLAEIYSIVNDNEIITHNVKEKKGIGFGR